MKYADRFGNITEDDNGQDRLLRWMYTTVPGRIIVRILVNPVISKIGGRVMSSKISALAIPSFCRANNIDMSQYEEKEFSSYNEFFIRKIKKDKRPVDMCSEHVISPCDSKLSIYKINSDTSFNIKNTRYTVGQLLKDKKLAKHYEGGYACVFRLTVDDYHRYCYIDNGVQGKSRFIKGVLHTVNPVANDVYPIYKENCREYSILKSDNFGRVLMMEVGALMIGKIVNYRNNCQVKKGQEKGRFEFGGSTVVLLFEKNSIIPDEDIINNTNNNCETKVKMGEKFARAAKKQL